MCVVCVHVACVCTCVEVGEHCLYVHVCKCTRVYVCTHLFLCFLPCVYV